MPSIIREHDHSTDLSLLRDLERRHLVTIGLRQSPAMTDLAGRRHPMHLLLDNVSGLLIVAAVLLVLFGHWRIGLAGLAFTGVYAAAVSGTGSRLMRSDVLEDEALFEQLYSANLVSIRVAETGGLIAFPQDWRAVFGQLEASVAAG